MKLDLPGRQKIKKPKPQISWKIASESSATLWFGLFEFMKRAHTRQSLYRSVKQIREMTLLHASPSVLGYVSYM